MTNRVHETAMREAGTAYMSANASVVAILKAVTQHGVDEAYINTLKFEFYIGGMLTVEPDEAKARAYLPDDNLKTVKRCAFSPFPSAKPHTFDAAKHRPENVQRVFNQMKANWSNYRDAAGLPLKKASPKGAQTGGKGKGGKGETEEGDVLITIDALAVEAGLDTAAIVKYVKAFDGWLTATLNTNKTRVRGDAGEVLRKIEADMHAYVSDLAKGLLRDAAPLPTPTHATDRAPATYQSAEGRRRSTLSRG